MAKARGEDHPRWNGGRTSKRGYIFIAMPNHPRANYCGYVLEHILVAEKALGYSLPSGVVVHHVDRQRDRNVNHNLVICENESYHRLLHQRQRALEAGFQAHWLKCNYCKIYDDPLNLLVSMSKTTRTNHCAVHRSCRQEKDRLRIREKRGSV